jgi:hypothetical protein
MNTRTITAFLVLGMAAALFFTYFRPSHRSLASVIGSPAAAQAPDANVISVKSVPNMSTTDDLWQHFEVTVPPTNPPLDMHITFLVDGHGEETVDMSPTARSQPLPFKYRMDHDDDSRVKDILEAQGLPVKKNLVTYTCAFEAGNGISFSKTIRFRHEMGGPQEELGSNETVSASVGQKIILQNDVVADQGFTGDLSKIMTTEQQLQPEYAPKTLPGMVHHLVVYVLFTPHRGAAVTERRSISRSI